jgi:hypothetical protein
MSHNKILIGVLTTKGTKDTKGTKALDPVKGSQPF